MMILMQVVIIIVDPDERGIWWVCHGIGLKPMGTPCNRDPGDPVHVFLHLKMVYDLYVIGIGVYKVRPPSCKLVCKAILKPWILLGNQVLWVNLVTPWSMGLAWPFQTRSKACSGSVLRARKSQSIWNVPPVESGATPYKQRERQLCTRWCRKGWAAGPREGLYILLIPLVYIH